MERSEWPSGRSIRDREFRDREARYKREWAQRDRANEKDYYRARERVTSPKRRKTTRDETETFSDTGERTVREYHDVREPKMSYSGRMTQAQRDRYIRERGTLTESPRSAMRSHYYSGEDEAHYRENEQIGSRERERAKDKREKDSDERLPKDREKERTKADPVESTPRGKHEISKRDRSPARQRSRGSSLEDDGEQSDKRSVRNYGPECFSETPETEDRRSRKEGERGQDDNERTDVRFKDSNDKLSRRSSLSEDDDSDTRRTRRSMDRGLLSPQQSPPRKRLGWGEGLVAFEKQRQQPGGSDFSGKSPPYELLEPRSPSRAYDLEKEESEDETDDPPVRHSPQHLSADIKSPTDPSTPSSSLPPTPERRSPSVERISKRMRRDFYQDKDSEPRVANDETRNPKEARGEEENELAESFDKEKQLRGESSNNSRYGIYSGMGLGYPIAGAVDVRDIAALARERASLVNSTLLHNSGNYSGYSYGGLYPATSLSPRRRPGSPGGGDRDKRGNFAATQLPSQTSTSSVINGTKPSSPPRQRVSIMEGNKRKKEPLFSDDGTIQEWNTASSSLPHLYKAWPSSPPAHARSASPITEIPLSPPTVISEASTTLPSKEDIVQNIDRVDVEIQRIETEIRSLLSLPKKREEEARLTKERVVREIEQQKQRELERMEQKAKEEQEKHAIEVAQEKLAKEEQEQQEQQQEQQQQEQQKQEQQQQEQQQQEQQQQEQHQQEQHQQDQQQQQEQDVDSDTERATVLYRSNIKTALEVEEEYSPDIAELGPAPTFPPPLVLNEAVKRVIIRQKLARAQKLADATAEYKRIQVAYGNKQQWKDAERAKRELKRRQRKRKRAIEVERERDLGFGRRGGVGKRDTVNSEAELEQVMSELAAQDNLQSTSKRYIKTLAIAPEMLVFASPAAATPFYDRNNLVTDPWAEEREFRSRALWTDEEKRLFVQQYCKYPKNFRAIAQALKKPKDDCVLFYYLNKYNLNLKGEMQRRLQALAEQPRRKGRKVPGAREVQNLTLHGSEYWQQDATRGSRPSRSLRDDRPLSKQPSIMSRSPSDTRIRPDSRGRPSIMGTARTSSSLGLRPTEPDHSGRSLEPSPIGSPPSSPILTRSNRYDDCSSISGSARDQEEEFAQIDELPTKRAKITRKSLNQIRPKVRVKVDRSPGRSPAPSPTQSPLVLVGEEDDGTDSSRMRKSGKPRKKTNDPRVKLRIAETIIQNDTYNAKSPVPQSVPNPVTNRPKGRPRPPGTASRKRDRVRAATKPKLRAPRPPPGVEEALDRWTDSETLLFAEAFSNISKDFKSIAEYIGTKNQFQCKEYYYNHKARLGLDDAFDKTPRRAYTSTDHQPETAFSPLLSVDKPKPSSPSPVPCNWTTQEKSEFLKHMTVYGRNWKMLAQLIPSKTQAQIKNYYKIYKQKLSLNSSSLESKELARAPTETNNHDNLYPLREKRTVEMEVDPEPELVDKKPYTGATRGRRRKNPTIATASLGTHAATHAVAPNSIPTATYNTPVTTVTACASTYAGKKAQAPFPTQNTTAKNKSAISSILNTQTQSDTTQAGDSPGPANWFAPGNISDVSSAKLGSGEFNLFSSSVHNSTSTALPPLAHSGITSPHQSHYLHYNTSSSGSLPSPSSILSGINLPPSSLPPILSSQLFSPPASAKPPPVSSIHPTGSSSPLPSPSVSTAPHDGGEAVLGVRPDLTHSTSYTLYGSNLYGEGAGPPRFGAEPRSFAGLNSTVVADYPAHQYRRVGRVASQRSTSPSGLDPSTSGFLYHHREQEDDPHYRSQPYSSSEPSSYRGILRSDDMQHPTPKESPISSVAQREEHKAAGIMTATTFDSASLPAMAGPQPPTSPSTMQPTNIFSAPSIKHQVPVEPWPSHSHPSTIRTPAQTLPTLHLPGPPLLSHTHSQPYLVVPHFPLAYSQTPIGGQHTSFGLQFPLGTQPAKPEPTDNRFAQPPLQQLQTPQQPRQTETSMLQTHAGHGPFTLPLVSPVDDDKNNFRAEITALLQQTQQTRPKPPPPPLNE
eukprot:TRINITY_DN5329_c0_g1_i9.p1 TRINITY_DN5329_c0_g1~~TRINITY_DN5329_c0_g1_i9.p1  ORF type:complete len:2024 (+),score=277.40 TRINITY_DN5329_c0_g1_i9:125-6196(+)